MIKSDFGLVAIEGAKPVILAELTTLLRVLRNGGVSDAEIDRCVERAKKSGKAVVVSVDADTPAEDVGKKIAEIVAKTLREMKEE